MARSEVPADRLRHTPYANGILTRPIRKSYVAIVTASSARRCGLPWDSVAVLNSRSLYGLLHVGLALTLFLSATVRAEENAAPAAPPASGSTDAGDLWRRVRHAAPRDDAQPGAV